MGKAWLASQQMSYWKPLFYFSLVSLTCSGWEGEGICNTSKDRDLLTFSTHVSLEQWKSLLCESYFSPVEGELALIKTVFFPPSCNYNKIQNYASEHN